MQCNVNVMHCNVMYCNNYCIVLFGLVWGLPVSFFFYLDYGIYCIVLYIEMLRFVLNYVFVFFGLDWLVFDWLCFCFDLDSFAFVFYWLGVCLICFISVSFDLMVWYMFINLFFFILTGGSTVDWNSVKDRNRLLNVSIFIS